MRLPPHRRDVLLGAAAAALASPLAACGGQASSDLAITEFADGLAIITGAGGNVTVARGPDGAVLVDTGSAEHADALVRAAPRAVGARRIAAAFNTHWHLDQTGGNAKLGAQGVPIIAHENTRLWMTTEIYRRWEEKTYPPAPVAARPSETIYTKAEMALGDETIEYGYERYAHTDGDIYVKFRNANVIAAGGMLKGQGWPLIDWSTGGWLGGMIDGITALTEISDEATRFVPESGPVLTRADVDRQLAMYTTIMDRLREHLYASHGPDEILAAAPTAEFDAEMGDPTQFVTMAFQSFWGHLRSDRRVSSF